jgi:hypothetical protein
MFTTTTSKQLKITKAQSQTVGILKKSIRKQISIYRVCPKKHRKPYPRYLLWLDLNETKTGINHFKSTISTA